MYGARDKLLSRPGFPKDKGIRMYRRYAVDDAVDAHPFIRPAHVIYIERVLAFMCMPLINMTLD